jgi:hypothetical protein
MSGGVEYRAQLVTCFDIGEQPNGGAHLPAPSLHNHRLSKPSNEYLDLATGHFC